MPFFYFFMLKRRYKYTEKEENNRLQILEVQKAKINPKLWNVIHTKTKS